MKKSFEPNFKTTEDKFSKVEINKINAQLMGSLKEELNDTVKPDIVWEAEQVAKSYGIYMEFNRAKTGKEKDWMYMIRISNPGGGPINKDQWNVFNELSDTYTRDSEGHPSLRFTTRQNIQFHWIKKEGVVDIVKSLAEKDMRSLNGCGDNTRNVCGCPISRYSDIFNAHAWTKKTADYFQLPLKPFIELFAIDPNYLRVPEQSYSYKHNLLNRKFKIAFSAVHRDIDTDKIVYDNCVELRMNDLGVAPIIGNDKVDAFQLYVGGSQGQRNGKPTMAALGEPVCQVNESNLLEAMEAVIKVHEEWGDRENRHWARVKYLMKKKGADWYRERMQERVKFTLEKPNLDHDYGDRHLHHGWQYQPSNGLWSYGAYIENGRITDVGINGRLKKMVTDVVNKYDNEIMITPNQDVIFTDIPEGKKSEFEEDLQKYGYGKRHGKAYSQLRLRSGACVGRDTCRLTYTDSEKFEPELIDQLEEMGWGDMKESIGITGCESQCFRPATKSIGLVGSGLNRYQFKLFGDDSARFQGMPLISGDGEKIYLRSVLREDVPKVIDALFKFYKNNAKDGEGLGAFHRRVGADQIIKYLKENPETEDQMEKTFHTDWEIE